MQVTDQCDSIKDECNETGKCAKITPQAESPYFWALYRQWREHPTLAHAQIIIDERITSMAGLNAKFLAAENYLGEESQSFPMFTLWERLSFDMERFARQEMFQ